MIKKFFLAQAIIEGGAGVILVLRPDFLLFAADAGPHALVLAKLYGIAAFTLGAISFLMYKGFSYTELFRKSALAFIAFHFLVALHMYSVYAQQLTPHAGAFGTHIALSILLTFAYLKEKEQFLSDQPDSEGQSGGLH
jgi:hypothetical protein